MIGATLIAASLIAALECIPIALPSLNQTEQRLNRLDVTRRIRYGHPTTYRDYPYLVYFDFPIGTGTMGCTGSFIALTWILTAAHCVVPMEQRVGERRHFVNLFSVADEPGLGSSLGAPRSRPVIVVSTHVQPFYRGGFDPEDIGLIELFESPPGIGLISLPTPYEEEEAIERGFRWTFVGAGLLTPGRPSIKYTDIRTDCLGDFQFCAYMDCVLTIACRGDSGSPLHFVSRVAHQEGADVVLAVHSQDNSGCLALRPRELARHKVEFYASVTDAMTWILRTLGDDYVDTRPINLTSMWASPYRQAPAPPPML